MAFPILGTAIPQFYDNVGNPLDSGSIEIRDPASNGLKNTYPTADDADAATNSNPSTIELNVRGEPETQVWGIDGQTYKVTLRDANVVDVWSITDIGWGQSLVPSTAVKYGQTAAEIAAAITPSDYSYQGDESSFIDIRRYGAAVDGVTDDTTAVQAAIDVAEASGGAQIFFPQGITKITEIFSNTDSDIVFFGVSGSGYAGETGKGSAIYSTTTTGDVITFGDGGTGKQNWEIRNLWISANTTGAILFLNRAPFCTLTNVYILNDTAAGGFGVYAYDSFHFAAYNCHLLKKTDERTTGSYGFRSHISGTISGLYSFYNTRIRGWERGWSIGQTSTSEWDHASRSFTGSTVFPSTSENLNLNLYSCQGKSNGIDLDLGSGCHSATINGSYFEGGDSGIIRAHYGARNINITGNMFNLGGASEGIRIGTALETPESRYFENIIVQSNFFRAIEAGAKAIIVNGDDNGLSSCKIWDNDFELETATSLGIELAAGNYVADVRRNVFTDPNALTPTYCTISVRPKVWEDTARSAANPVYKYTNLEQLVAAGNRTLTVDDTEIQNFTCDGTGRTVKLPLASLSRGKKFIITNYDPDDIVIVADSTGVETLATLAVRIAGTPDLVDVAYCSCDGSFWTVLDCGAAYTRPTLAIN